MNLKILSISPAPDDLFAIFRDDDGGTHADKVVYMALAVETVFREGPSLERLIPDPDFTIVVGLTITDCGLTPPEEASNFAGYALAEDLDEETMAERFGK